MRAKTTTATPEPETEANMETTPETEATSAVTPEADVPEQAPSAETDPGEAVAQKPKRQKKPEAVPLVFDATPVPEDLKHGGIRKKTHGNRKHFLWSMEIGGSVFVPEEHTSFSGVCSAAKAISTKDPSYVFSVLQVDDGSRVWRVQPSEQPAPQTETGEEPADQADAA